MQVDVKNNYKGLGKAIVVNTSVDVVVDMLDADGQDTDVTVLNYKDVILEMVKKVDDTAMFVDGKLWFNLGPVNFLVDLK